MAGIEGEVRAVDSGHVGLGPRLRVRCVCDHVLFDGVVVRSRVVRLLPRGGAEALCRCKRWQLVPLTYDESKFREAGISIKPPPGANLAAQA